MAIDATQIDPLGGLIGGALGYFGSSQNGLNLQNIGQAGTGALTGLQSIANGQTRQQISPDLLSTYNNPYLDQSIAAGQRGLTNQFNQQVLPGITDTFSNAGSLGSGRQAALTGVATQNFTNKLADIDAQQRSNAYNAAYTAAVNAGGQNFAAQQNALGKIYTSAANNAGQAPWIQALSGAAVGSGLGNALGQAGSNAIGNIASNAASYLKSQFPNIFSQGFTPPAGAIQAGNGGYSWPTADGGTILRNPDGSINLTDANGNVQLFSNSGASLGTIPADNFGLNDIGSGLDLSGGDTSWIDNTDWSNIGGGSDIGGGLDFGGGGFDFGGWDLFF